MSAAREQELWEELGEEGFAKIVASFYQRVRADELIGPMYPEDDWEGSERRLWLFLCFRFGADQRYMEERGHPRLRARHLPFRIGEKERDRWLELMKASMEEAAVSSSAQETLHAFFFQVADFMRNEDQAKFNLHSAPLRDPLSKLRKD